MDTSRDPIDLVLKALADPNRRAIVELLAAEPLAVGELAERFPVSRPAISKHLRLLEEAGLVVPEQQGRRRLCTLDIGPARGVQRWLQQLGRRTPAADPGVPEERLQPVLETPEPALAVRREAPEEGWRCW